MTAMVRPFIMLKLYAPACLLVLFASCSDGLSVKGRLVESDGIDAFFNRIVANRGKQEIGGTRLASPINDAEGQYQGARFLDLISKRYRGKQSVEN